MKWFNQLFGSKSELKECPRCLGKGHVDLNDVKRLKKELHWGTGKCAYCNGKGKVDAEMIIKVPADATYLTTDLGWQERRRFIDGDPEVLERAAFDAEEREDFINAVWHMHALNNLNAEQIANFFLTSKPQPANRRKEMIRYIEKVILEKSKRHR